MDLVMLQQSMSQHILKVYEFLLVLTQGFRVRSKLFQRLVFVYLELAPSQFLFSRTGTIVVVVDNNVLFIILTATVTVRAIFLC